VANSNPQSGDVINMLGTRKGSFLFWSDQNRGQWKASIMRAGLYPMLLEEETL